ncbi:MAG TPA: YidC/Oxa1 family membrane protein insertase [Solirubrobacteraceae bacterium]|nr:YidC/Oxa1 family membrane protein insertase [Solirubrobacteraceae bacterium]
MPILANVIEDAFSPLISLFQAIMVFIHDNVVGGSWGLAIVGLTVTIRAVLVPLTFRQLKSMQEMQRLAPEINKLKEKYKEDKQRQQQELMKFYQENKINPLASCLPLLLQLPVFISLFYMLRTDLKKKICGGQLVEHFNNAGLAAKFGGPQHVASVAHLPGKYVEQTSCDTVAHHSAKFLFLPDITSKATGAALVVLIVLYVGSQLASTLIATATADPTQRRLMLILPVVFVIILYRYPAGLLVYWITTNLWTIAQQSVIRRRMPPPPRPVPSADANGKPKGLLKPLLEQARADAASRSSAGEPAAAPSGAKAGSEKGGGAPPAAPPPRPPRKKKKRSGRRR